MIPKLRCSVPECGEMFPRMPELKTHYRTVHPERARPYKCPDCRRLYVDTRGLKEHRRKKHPQEGQGVVLYSCPHCPYTTNKKFNLNKVHLKTAHKRLLAESLSNTEETVDVAQNSSSSFQEEETVNVSEEEETVNVSEEEEIVDVSEDEDMPIIGSLQLRIQELESRQLGEGEQIQLGNLRERLAIFVSLNITKEVDKEELIAKKRRRKQRAAAKAKRAKVSQEPSRRSERLAIQLPEADCQMDIELELQLQKLLEDQATPSPKEVVTRLLEAVLELTLQTVTVSQEEPKKREAVVCLVCQKKFRDKGNLGRHVASLHTSNPEAWQCSKSFCVQQFLTQWEMIIHRRLCVFTCARCGWTTNRTGEDRTIGHERLCSRAY